MIEPLIVITFCIIQFHTFVSSFPTAESEFDCVELPRKHLTERNNFANPRLATTLLHEERPTVNTSQQRFNVPCFNASFPTSLTVEEGSDVVLPCVVHNVDFNSIVVGILCALYSMEKRHYFLLSIKIAVQNSNLVMFGSAP